ncbi:helix-turn-helix domain-containing protein, partial [Mangrovimonas sp. AS39]|nr:helix-turn-helix domain-containing protein [Mangrovimonas futianensis]
MSNDQKSLCRVVHNKNYTIINNTICKDNRISYKAKGIWLYAFSRPDDWNFYLCDIMNQSSDGKDSVSSGLSELENSGYLKRERTKDKKGRFSGWTYIFYETPREIQKISPKREKPDIGKTRTRENPLLLSTDSLPSTEKKQ